MAYLTNENTGIAHVYQQENQQENQEEKQQAKPV
jgi:hypothetical protein